MKDEKEKIKEIALRIVELEKKCRTDAENVSSYMSEMMQLTDHLSLEELLQVDEYILENKILTK